jgi:hypothetical protein
MQAIYKEHPDVKPAHCLRASRFSAALLHSY